MFKLACIQTNSGPDIADNLAVITDYAKEAADKGAKFIATPENSCHMRFPPGEKLKTCPDADNHPALQDMPDLAKSLGVWLLLGSISVKVAPDKIANRSVLISDKGDIVATYDKIHLFDVDLKDGESYRESNNVRAGQKAVVSQTPWGKLGLSICYDVRFPHLYRTLAQSGAFMLTVPAAFTVPTGKAHWHTLLRARAIENGAYVIAPGQCGTHEGGRQTFGHSLIIDPWGSVLADGGDEPGIIMADIDPENVTKTRASIPSLQHDRAFQVTEV